MHYHPVFAAALLLTSQQTIANENHYSYDDEGLTVTAARVTQTVDNSLAPVEIFTKQDIERLQVNSLQDLFRGSPGLSLSNNGGPGKATSLFLRGTESDHLLVLVDGFKITSATTGNATFQNIPLSLIERIEIVRGPRASLYGSEAIGGVIQIFTHKGKDKKSSSFAVGIGSNQSSYSSGQVSGKHNQIKYSASFSGSETDSFNACRSEAEATGGCFTNEDDNDGYQNLAGTLRLGYQLSDKAELDVQFIQSRGKSEFDGNFTNESKTENTIYGANLSFAGSENWFGKLTAGRSYDKSNNFKNSEFKSQFDTRHDTASIQNSIMITASNVFTTGIDYQRSVVVSSEKFSTTKRDNLAGFAQWQGFYKNHDVQFSLRGDDNEQFGHHLTGGAAWGISLPKKLRLIASYGTAFKAPSFNELYYPDFGNKSLQPETSASLELALKAQQKWGHWSINTFKTDIKDLIAYDASIGLPSNLNAAQIIGVESSATLQLAQWNVSGNITLLRPENRSSDTNRGNILPRRAKQSARIDIDRKFKTHGIGATLNAAGARYDDIANTQKLEGYETIDIRGETQISKNWLAQARVENLLNKSYETAKFYNQADRSIYLTVRYQH